jgi:hypothetical protein
MRTALGYVGLALALGDWQGLSRTSTGYGDLHGLTLTGMGYWGLQLAMGGFHGL